MGKLRHKNTDKVSRRQGKAFLFDSCSLFRLLNTFANSHMQTLIILSDRDAQITMSAFLGVPVKEHVIKTLRKYFSNFNA